MNREIHKQLNKAHCPPIDVQHPYEGLGQPPLGVESRVEPLDGPDEQLLINVFGQCISGVYSLLPGHGFDQHLPPYSQPAMAQPVGHLRPFNTQQFGEDGQRAIVCLDGGKKGLPYMHCPDIL